jgi:phosphoribosylpyrophosphate synthetase
MTIHVAGWSDSDQPFVFEPTFGLYPDNTPYVKGVPPDGSLIDSVFIRPTSLQHFYAGLWYVSELSNMGSGNIDLYIPFFPCSRQDRSNEDGDILNSKYRVMRDIARMINEGDVGKVTTFDIHSEAHNSLLGDRLINIPAAEIIRCAIAEFGMNLNPTPNYYDAVIAPDEGARARAEMVGAMYHIPVLVAEKHRDLSTGYITSFELKDEFPFPPEKILVVDDICDGGNTFRILSESLPDNLEKHLFVTHGIFSNHSSVTLRNHYDHILTTNSTFGYREGVQTINLFPGVFNDA